MLCFFLKKNDFEKKTFFFSQNIFDVLFFNKINNMVRLVFCREMPRSKFCKKMSLADWQLAQQTRKQKEHADGTKQPETKEPMAMSSFADHQLTQTTIPLSLSVNCKQEETTITEDEKQKELGTVREDDEKLLPMMPMDLFITYFRRDIQQLVAKLRQFHLEQARVLEKENQPVDYGKSEEERVNYALMEWKKLEKTWDTRLASVRFNVLGLMDIFGFILQHRVKNNLVERESGRFEARHHSRPLRITRLCERGRALYCPLKENLSWCDMIHKEDLEAGSLVYTIVIDDDCIASQIPRLSFLWIERKRWDQYCAAQCVFSMMSTEQREKTNAHYSQRFDFFYHFSKQLQGCDIARSSSLYHDTIMVKVDTSSSFSKHDKHFRWIASFEEIMTFYNLQWNVNQFAQFARVGANPWNTECYLLNLLVNGVLPSFLVDALPSLPETFQIDDSTMHLQAYLRLPTLQQWLMTYGAETMWTYLNDFQWVTFTFPHHNLLQVNQATRQPILKDVLFEDVPFTACTTETNTFTEQVAELRLAYKFVNFLIFNTLECPQNFPSHVILPENEFSYNAKCELVYKKKWNASKSEYARIIVYMMRFGGNCDSIESTDKSFEEWYFRTQT